MAAPEHSEFDLAVVGGGPIGLACAWRAAQRGLSVVVLERDPSGPGAGASHVAAGMLAPVAEAEFAERPGLELGLASAQRWPAFASELEAAAGMEVGYLSCGTLVVARDRDEAEGLDRELAFRRSVGLEVERLLPSAARRLEPALAPSIRLAFEAADDHAVDPRRLVAALAQAAGRAGVTVRSGAEVAALARDGDRVTGVSLADGERVAAEQVLVAAGAWSAAVGGVPVRPVKGQLLLLRDPDGPGAVDHVIRLDSGYLVPRSDGRYVLGASVEERGFDRSVTAGPLLELLRDAAEVVPAVQEWEVLELLAGFRPGTPDNAPILGRGEADGLVWATGHYRNGILLTPITAELTLPLLLGEEQPELARAFAPGRFASAGVAA